MSIDITSNSLNRIGLLLGLVSGLLLIPEVFNLLPIEKLENSIEHKLSIIESWANFPLRFSPPSWQFRYTKEQREAIELPTALRSLIFSMVWISFLVVGLRIRSTVLIILSLIILIAVVLRNIALHLTSWRFLSPLRLALIFISMLFILAIATPLISVIRVIMLTLRSITIKLHKFFSTHDVLRSSLIILAILLFMISNFLQYVATFY